MAGLAVPVIEGAGVLLMRALGVSAVTAGGAAVVDAQRQRQEEAAANARGTAISQAGTQAKAKPCDKCPPDAGIPVNRSTAGWSQVSIAYQARIGGLPVGAGAITEWMFGGLTFDGFDSSQCLLKEAKAKYDQFFDEFGYRRDFWKGDEALIAQAVAQSAAAMPQPPVQLHWYFMESLSYRYFSKIFSSAKLRIQTVFQP